MNFQSLRRLQTKLSVAFMFMAAATLALTSCGGGGATGSPGAAGQLRVLPSTATIYAGVPYKANIVGGRKPFLVTSSEQALIELNFTTESTEFSFVARNPGVVDVGLSADEVPRRSVNIEVRDSAGANFVAKYDVLQNFFTGYHEFYQNTCAAPTGTTPPQACSGTDSIITVLPISNGTLYGNRDLQFDKVRGDYSFVVEDPSVTPQLVDRIRVRTDQTGKAIVRIRVAVNAPTQLATYKITDILTGVTMDVVFMIVQAPPVDAITLIPSTLTFTGSLSTICGGGSADVFIFGGVPPYTVTAPTGVGVSPIIVTSSGGRFTVTVSGGIGFSPTGGVPACLTGAPVVVTDSRGAIAVETVNTEVGAGTLPALAAAPVTIGTLLCGQSSQVTVVGGTGAYTANSQHPQITATVSGSTVTVTRLLHDLPAGTYPTASSVTVTDGATIITIAISATPASCP